MWLWGLLARREAAPCGTLHVPGSQIPLAALQTGSILGDRLEALRGRTVLIAARDQLTAAVALLELDGVAKRVVLCPPDLPEAHFGAVLRESGAAACVRDPATPALEGIEKNLSIEAQPRVVQCDIERRQTHPTEWILLTSGTTGIPKLVLHTLTSLTHAFARQPLDEAGSRVWSTFYDIRRYGGLQIFLRALRSGSMVLSSQSEPVADFLGRAGSAQVTHISGTPSHWRKALMSGFASRISPTYVRLSGEIADQAILDNLRAIFPQASIAHAFASTEAGVAFSVEDGLTGFPPSLLNGSTRAGAEIRIEDDTLRVHSAGSATRYLGHEGDLRDAQGFVNTGDRVELRDGRYYFMGRSGGIINVGGLKVHPEEVEAVINSHPRVRMSLVKARRNPITGAVVTADVVLTETEAAPSAARSADERLKQEILDACRGSLAAHKVPAVIRIVPALEVSASGKLVRPNA